MMLGAGRSGRGLEASACELVGVATGVEDGVAQVRAVEPGDELLGVAEVELGGDVAPDDVGGRRRQGDARRRRRSAAARAPILA